MDPPAISETPSLKHMQQRFTSNAGTPPCKHQPAQTRRTPLILMRLPGSGPLTYTRGTVISAVVQFCKVEAKRMSHCCSISTLFLVAGFVTVASADIITFGGMITQAQDP